MQHSLAKAKTDWLRFPGACPGWDNTPRRPTNGLLLPGRHPEIYQSWVREAIRRADSEREREGTNLIFINAWNEWGEGAYLEPCERWGSSFLEAHRGAVNVEVAEPGPDLG
jgi:hypothetical protein